MNAVRALFTVFRSQPVKLPVVLECVSLAEDNSQFISTTFSTHSSEKKNEFAI